MFVWMKKRYLYSDDTVGASLDETWSAYKSGKHTNLSGSSLKKRLWDSWWQRRGFHTKVLYQKVVFFNQGVFLCEFSLGRRLHTRKTKKWHFGPRMSDDRENYSWTLRRSSGEAFWTWWHPFCTCSCENHLLILHFLSFLLGLCSFWGKQLQHHFDLMSKK